MSLGDEFLQKLVAEGYEPEAVATVATAVEMFSDMLMVDPANGDRLRATIDRMASLVNSRLPEVEQGVRVQIEIDDLDGTLEPLPDDMVTMVIELVGTIMFEGTDGPFQAGMHLKEGVEALEAAA